MILHKHNLGKKIGISFFSILIVTFLVAASFNTGAQFETATQSTIEELEQINYQILFETPSISLQQADSNTYSNVNLKGCISTGSTPGQPMLPRKIIQLALPPNTELNTITTTNEETHIIQDATLLSSPVLPYQASVPFGHSEPQEFIVDQQLYATDDMYPNQVIQDYSIGYSHGYPIVGITLNPVQYNPVKGEIVYYSSVTLELDLEYTDTINQFYRNNPEDKAWVQSIVSNPDILDKHTLPSPPMFDYPGGLCDSNDNYDYVIITTTYNGLDYWDTTSSIPYNWESLMDKHSIDNGLSCTLVTVQDIDACTDYHDSNPMFNDQQAHIREFCKDAYQDWGTQYILIGGDEESTYIPTREMDTSYETSIDADIYWSNLDSTFNEDGDTRWGEEGDAGFDLYAEIFIGRLTCDEPQDVSNWMTKSFAYADAGDIDYLDNTAFYGGNTGWSCQGDDFMDFSAVKGTDDWLGPQPHHDGPWPSWLGFLYGFETWNDNNPSLPYDMDHLWTAEPPNPGWQGGSESQAIAGLKAAISADEATIISGIAHANSDMSLDVYYTEWESDYHNTKPFFLHDYGCHCGDMDASNDGVLHSMLFHSDTELAFGVVFNTCYGWGNLYCTNSSSALQAKLFWDYFLDVANNSQSTANWELGKAHAWTKDVMAPTIDWEHTWRAILQGCLLFADPAQKLKPPNAPPVQPTTPDGPDEGVTGYEYTFTSSTTEPEGEDIYFRFDWGNGEYSNWYGPYDSGDSCDASYAWEDIGDYDVKVQAKDENGGESSWSDPHTITILQAPIMDVRPISSGLLNVDALIKNVGAVEATNVEWKITLEGGTILMGRESTGTIASIAAGDGATVSSTPILGFGNTKIIVEATVPESSDMREQSAMVLLFYVHVVPGGG